MAKHANLPPSSAHRWMECPGSVRLEALLPEAPSSEYAEEGTVAHQMAENCLRGNADAFVYEGVKASDLMHPEKLEHDDFLIDMEMCEAVQLYLDVVRESDDGSGEMTMLVEQKFKVDPQCWGTNDACTYKEFGKLTIFDLKYGRGVQVEVENNPQLMIYLLGVALTTNCFEFEIVVIQPRGHHPEGPVRRHTVTIKELTEFRVWLLMCIHSTQQPGASLQAGEHCRWCSASGSCPKQQEIALAEFEPVNQEGPTPPEVMGGEDLARIVSKAGQFRTWLDACEKRAKELVQAGTSLKGLKLVHSSGRRAWDENADVETLAADCGIEDCYAEPKLVSPAQFEKLLTKGGYKPKERKELLEGMTRTPSNQVLVPESDKRKAIANATEQFKAVE